MMLFPMGSVEGFFLFIFIGGPENTEWTLGMLRDEFPGLHELKSHNASRAEISVQTESRPLISARDVSCRHSGNPSGGLEERSGGRYFRIGQRTRRFSFAFPLFLLLLHDTIIIGLF